MYNLSSFHHAVIQQVSCLTTLDVKIQAVEAGCQIHQGTQANLDRLQCYKAYGIQKDGLH